jgi:hypothetical protein
MRMGSSTKLEATGTTRGSMDLHRGLVRVLLRGLSLWWLSKRLIDWFLVGGWIKAKLNGGLTTWSCTHLHWGLILLTNITSVPMISLPTKGIISLTLIILLLLLLLLLGLWLLLWSIIPTEGEVTLVRISSLWASLLLTIISPTKLDTTLTSWCVLHLHRSLPLLTNIWGCPWHLFLLIYTVKF